MTVWGNGSKKEPTVTSGYGPRKGGAFSFHYGTDFDGYSSVKSIESGKVTFAGFMNNNAGNAVAYDLDEKGPKGEVITVVHMHLSSVSVKVGQRLGEGQKIGNMGSTGNATGKCDHIEIRFWLGGKYTTTNPVPWISGRIKNEAAVTTGVRTRKTKAYSNARTAPNTGAAIDKGSSLKKGVVGSFDGYTIGQSVEGNNVWFRGAFHKRWYWSGAFEGGPNTAGLKKL
jgi:murein DD-endopeptidase MepM/ murein hydrolase activator NlpD